MATINGTSSNDTLNGTASKDTISGGAGNDIVNGVAGNDSLYGGDGNDTINGGSGNDYINAGSGNDTLDGGSGSDKLYAGAGDDKLIYNVSENRGACDYYNGETGNDTLVLIFTQSLLQQLASQNCYSSSTAYINALTAYFNCRAGSSFDLSSFGLNLQVNKIENLIIQISSTNVAPVAVNDVGAVNENSTLTKSASAGLLINDTDANVGDTKAVSSISKGSLSASVNSSTAGVITTDYGKLTVNADGSYSYIANGSLSNVLRQGVTATDVFTYTMKDAAGASASATLTITITGQNDAPIAVADVGNVTQNATLSILQSAGLLINDTDPDVGDTKAVSQISKGTTNVVVSSSTPGVITSIYGTLTVYADGHYNYVANGAASVALPKDVTAVDEFTYTMKDAVGATSSTTLKITVKGINDTPTAVADAGAVNQGATLNVAVGSGLLINDTDKDTGDTKAVSQISKGATNVVVSSSTPGVITSTYGTLTVYADGHYNYVANGAASLALASGATATDVFSYTMKDSQGATSSTNLTMTITGVTNNHAPVAAADTYSTNEDTSLVIPVATGVLANDTDVDGNALNAILVSGPAHGTLVLNANGSFTYTPTANYFGSDSFTYNANDGSLNSNVATVNITVNPVNDAPSGANKTITTNEDTAYTFIAGDFGFSDLDANSLLAVKISSLPAAGSLQLNGAAVLAGDFISFANINSGLLKFIPATDANGNNYANFSFQVQDNGGVLNGGANLDPTPNTITLNVTAVNDAPVANNDNYSVDEDGVLNILIPGVLGNDSDIDGDVLNAILVSGPAHGTLVLNANGSFTYTPTANYFGADSFTYNANDGSLNSNIATVNITVNPVNDAPLANNDNNYSVDEDGVLNILIPGVLGNDSDIDGDVLNAILVSGPAHGVLSLNSDGSFTYTPNTNYNGDDSFVYKASDGLLSSNATVSINVVAVNDAPIAADNTVTTAENNSYQFQSADFGFNDPNDLPANHLLAVKVFTVPTSGELRWNDGATPHVVHAGDSISAADIQAGYLYFVPTTNPDDTPSGPHDTSPSTAPNPGGPPPSHGGSSTPSAPADVSFTFLVQDDGGIANGGVDLSQTPNTMTISVTSVNHAPIINGGDLVDINLAENNLIVTQISATDADLPPQTLTYSIVGGADQLLFAIDPQSGALSFVAAPDYENPADVDLNNIYEVVVQASDGSLVDTQTINVTVTPTNEFGVGVVTDANAAANAVDENAALGTVVGITALATDGDGDVVTYSLDNDAGGLFAIDANTGVVTVAGVLDYETASSYQIVVRAISADTSSSTENFIININPLNDNAPIINGDDLVDINLAENNLIVTQISATDADLPSQTLTYSIVGGADQLLFAIDPQSGALSFVAAPDYENPADVDLNNIYEVVVQVSDGSLVDTQTINVTVTPTNEFGVGVVTDANAAANAVDENAALGTVVGITALATDGDGDVVTYSLDNDAGGLFAIDADTGVVTVAGVLDYETASSYQIVVRAISADTSSSTENFTININPLNDNAPIINGDDLVDINLAENTTAVTAIVASDADLPPQTLTYSIVGGADQLLFAIDPQSGALSFVAAPDYENPADVDLNNIYEVVVQVSDGSLVDTQTINVTVTPTNEFGVGVVTDANAAANAVDENAALGTVVGITALATDGDGDVVTYSLDNDAGGLFAIDANTGVVTVAGVLDYETASSYQIVVRATSSDLSESTENFIININPLNDNAPIINGGDLVDINLAENNLIVTQISATDADLPPQTLTYSIVGGADQLLFAIDPQSGALSFVAAPDYENPADVDLNNIYEVVVQVSDGSLVDTQTINVTVTPTNEFGVGVITDANAAANAVDENVALGTVVGITALATDGDGDVVTYSLDNDAGGLFAIDADTGVVTVAGVLDYETASSYQIVVRATSSDLSESTENFIININPLNDNAPIINGDDLVDINLAENNLIVTQISATDADLPSQTLTYSIVGGADQLLFAIDPQSGALSFVAAPDYENPADVDLNNIYEVVVQVSDGSLVDTQTINVTVTPTNEFGVGVVTDANAAANAVDENAALGTVVGITALATDGDGDVVTYSLDNDAGGLFAIDADTGVVTVAGVLDYETASSYQIVVRAISADTSSSTENFTININPLNDNAPIINGGDLVDINLAENNLIVTQISATDADLPSQTLTYSIVGGADQLLFAIDPQSGALSFVAAPDYENPADVDLNNIYEVVVQVSDGSLVDTQTINVTVTPTNEFGVGVITDANAAANAVDENVALGTVVGITALATDGDGDVVTYSLDNDAGGLFAIDADTGVVTVAGVLDYETASSYQIVVRAISADTSSSTENFTININPLNDNAPIINGGDLVDINLAENNLIVTQISATDADLPSQTLTYSIVGGADQLLFAIDPQSGALSFVAAPDYENPADVDLNNIYEVVVQVSDGSLVDTQTINVTVTPTNEFGVGVITDANAAANAVDENVALGTVVGITALATDGDGDVVTYSLDNDAGGLFAIDADTGVVTVAGVLDYETASSYQIVVRATSSDLSESTENFIININPLNDNAPIINGDDLVDINLAENNLIVTQISATDADLPLQTLTYSIVGGADQLLFAIDPQSGALSFAAAPDYENPADVDLNNIYEVVVQASDGSLVDTQTINVTVTPTNEFGVGVVTDANAAANAVDENAALGTVVGITALATDGDGDVVTYSLDNDAGGLFAIDANTGIVTVAGVLDYETASSYQIVVRAISADTSSSTENFTININPLNDNAPNAGANINALIPENSANGAVVVASIPATDLDLPNDNLSYVIFSGNENNAFAINSTTGEIKILDATLLNLDYDDANSLVANLVVRVTDDANHFDDVNVTVNVMAVNDNAPVIISNGGDASANINIPENTTVVTIVVAGDADLPPQTLLYEIAGGADAALFQINSAGELSFIAAPDYENPVGSDNDYEVIVRVKDGAGLDALSDEQTIHVHVTPVNEAPFAFSDSFFPNEDTVLNIPAHVLSYGDFDVEDVLTVSVVNNPLHGLLVLNPDGSFVYTPNANYNGVDSFTYKVFDGALYSTGVGTVTINISSINDAPAGTDKIITTNEDTNYIFAASDFGFSDLNDNPENDFAAVQITQVPLAGQLIWNDGINSHVVTNNELINIADINNNYLKFVPGLNENGNGYASFTFQVQDNGSGVFPNVNLDPTVNTMTINVTAVNDAPYAFNDAFFPNEDTVLSVPAHVLSYGDFDVGDVLTVNVVNNPLHGLLVLNPDGSFVYTPNANYNGVDSFTYKVFDGALYSTGVGTVTINISSINDAPAGTDKIITTNEDTNYIFAASDFGFSDLNDNPENDFAAVQITQVPLAGQLIWNDGINSHVVTNNELINIADINNNYLKFVPGLNENGNGYASFTFQVQDNGSGVFPNVNLDPTVNTMTINVTAVNDAPYAFNDAFFPNEDTVLNIPAHVLSYGDFDVEDVLTVSVVNNPLHGLLVLNPDGSFVYTPNANYNGVDSFTYKVFDGALYSTGMGTVTINISSINDAPAGTDKIITTNEDTNYIFAASDFGFSDLNDNPENDFAAVQITQVPLAGQLIWNDGINSHVVTNNELINIADINNNYLKFVPGLNENGNGYASFTFQVQDNGSGVFPNVNLDPTVNTMTINVTAVNDAPYAFNDAFFPNEDTVLSVPAHVLSYGDFDVGDVLTVSVFNNPLHGLLVLNPDGSFVYTPNANYNGVDSFTYKVFDGALYSTGVGTVTINISSINDAPAGTDKIITTNEDTNYIFAASDFGFSDLNDNPENDFAAVQITQVPLAGQLIWNDGINSHVVTNNELINIADINNNYLKFVPGLNENGNGYASFTFQVQDNGSGVFPNVNLDPTVNTMTINVTAVNDAPYAFNDAFFPNEDTVLSVPAHVLSYGDFDVGDVLTVNVVNNPLHGLLVLNPDGSFVYTPNANYNGVDSFTYKVFDGALYSTGMGTVTINISSINDAPAGTDKIITTNEDTNYIFAASDFGFSDLNDNPENDFAAVQITQVPLAGQLIWNDGINSHVVTNNELINIADINNNYLKFVPGLNENGNGYASFTFQVQDNGSGVFPNVNLDPTVNTMTINVTAVNDAPYAFNDAFFPNEDTVLNIPAHVLSYGDFDVEDVLTVSVVNNPLHGLLVLNPDGSFTYTPNENYNGLDSFTYRVFDGSLYSAGVGTVSINVSPINDAPAGTDKTITINEDNIYIFTASDFGFTDPNDVPANNLLNVIVDALPVAGVLKLNGIAVDAGQIISFADISNLTFTPENDANGINYVSFTFQLQDNGGVLDGGIDTNQSSNAIIINVTPVNDAPVFATPSYNFSITENLPNGFSVGTVTATDIENNTVSYNIIAGNTNNAFAIDLNTGAITVNNYLQLDYETTQVFNLIIQALDNGVPAASSTTSVTVNLTDLPNLFTASADTVNFATLSLPLYANYEGDFYNALAGADNVTLLPYSDEATNMGFDFNQTFFAGADNDTVSFATSATNRQLTTMNMDLGAGIDSLTLTSGNDYNLVVSNAETITGADGNDQITLNTALTSGVINLGLGADVLNIAATSSANTITVSNIETINVSGLGSSNDTITSTTLFSAGSNVNLGNGSADVLNLAAGTNELSASNIENFNGTTSSDTLIFSNAQTYIFNTITVNLGLDTDTLILSSNGTDNRLAVNNVETIIGSDLNDVITINSGNIINLGLGTGDTVNFSVAGSITLSLAGVEFINAGGLDETLIISNPQNGLNINMSSGTDTLRLSNAGANTVTVSNTETILVNATTGTFDDVVTVTTGLSAGNFNLEAGTGDTINLANANNTVIVRNTEIINGGTQNDAITLNTQLLNGNIALGTGSDSVTLTTAGTSFSFSATGVESIIGTTSNFDDLTLLNAQNDSLVLVTVDLLAGTHDKLTLANGGNTLTVLNTEIISSGSGNDVITLGTVINIGTNLLPGTAGTVSLGSGLDSLILFGGGANSVRVNGVESISIASDGNFNDTVVALTAFTSGASVNLGGGVADVVNLNSNINTIALSGVESITGTASGDTLTLSNVQNGLSVDLVGANDTLNLAAGINLLSLINVETVNGSSSDDVLTLENAQSNNIRINLQGGADNLQLSSSGANTIQVSNIETVMGGSNNDKVTALTGFTAGNIVDLGSGTDDILLLQWSTNVLSAVGIEKIISASFDLDTLTLQNSVTNWMEIDLKDDVGASDDALYLADGGNNIVITNIETVIGGTGVDTLKFYQWTPPNLVLTNIEWLITNNLDLDETITLANNQNGLSIDLLGNNVGDTLNLVSGINALSIYGVEFVNGSGTNDTLMLSNSQNGVLVDLLGGNDVLILANDLNILSVSNVETIIGGTLEDAITLGAAQTAGVIDLGGGINSLTLYAGSTVTIGSMPGQLNVFNTGLILGTGSNETLTFSAAQTYLTVNLGFGTNDILTLSSLGANTLTVSNTESIIGGTQNDVVILGAAQTSGVINLGSGSDTLTLALSSAGANTLTVSNTETITGSTESDTITLGAAQATGVINLAGGTDILILSSSGNNTLTVSNVETILGGAVQDTITLGAAQTSGTINLLTGSLDTLVLAAGVNTLSILNTEFINGSNSVDTLTLNNALSGGVTIDLGLGTDTLILSSAGANTLTVSNTETITGGTQNDTITQGVAQTSGTIDLLTGSLDTLVLAAGVNTLSILNTEFINGSNSVDTLTLNNTLSGGVTIDLGLGTDTLILSSAGANTLTVSNTETITGGTQNDAITLNTVQTSGVIDLAGGTDILILSSSGNNTLTVSNVETILGGAVQDTITLGAAQTSGTINLLTGSLDTLILSSLGPNTLTVSNTEAITGGTQNDSITLGTALISGVINLGAGIDTLILSSAGANTLTISNTETITGSSAIDNLTVSAAISTVVVINGAGGADTIVGGVENDSIIGGLGIDTLTGGVGADTFVFNSASDYSSTEVINGTQEDGTLDTLLLLFGNGAAYDFTSAGANITNIDQILLGQDSDSISLILDEDVIAGADRNGNGSVGDLLIAASVPIFHGVVIDASAQNSTSDYIEVDGTNLNGGDIITGSDGPDIIMGGLGADTIIGGTGADTYIVRATVDFLIDGSSDSNFQAADTISTLSSLDTLKVVATEVHNFNHSSNTFIEPGGLVGIVDLNANGTYTNFTGNTDAGDVVLNFINATTLANFQARIAYDITAGTGSDTITTGSLDDILTGGAGADSLNGGSGNDVFVINAVTNSSSDSGRVQNVGNSNDTGQDVVTGFALGGDVLKIVGTNVSNFTHGTDTALGTAAGVDNGTVGSFTLNTGLVNLSHEATLTIDPGDVAVTFASPGGLTFNETNFEASLQYELTGTASINTIGTGALDDILTGGGGADTLTGGAGADIFKFTGTGDLGDRITDFSAAQLDKLWFSAAAFNGDSGTALASGALATSTVHNGANASNYWIFDNVARQLYYDADASGVGVGVLVANLTGVTVLNNTDIMFG